jgi:hypothetical protein
MMSLARFRSRHQPRVRQTHDRLLFGLGQEEPYGGEITGGTPEGVSTMPPVPSPPSVTPQPTPVSGPTTGWTTPTKPTPSTWEPPGAEAQGVYTQPTPPPTPVLPPPPPAPAPSVDCGGGVRAPSYAQCPMKTCAGGVKVSLNSACPEDYAAQVAAAQAAAAAAQASAPKTTTLTRCPGTTTFVTDLSQCPASVAAPSPAPSPAPAIAPSYTSTTPTPAPGVTTQAPVPVAPAIRPLPKPTPKPQYVAPPQPTIRGGIPRDLQEAKNIIDSIIASAVNLDSSDEYTAFKAAGQIGSNVKDNLATFSWLGALGARMGFRAPSDMMHYISLYSHTTQTPMGEYSYAIQAGQDIRAELQKISDGLGSALQATASAGAAISSAGQSIASGIQQIQTAYQIWKKLEPLLAKLRAAGITDPADYVRIYQAYKNGYKPGVIFSADANGYAAAAVEVGKILTEQAAAHGPSASPTAPVLSQAWQYTSDQWQQAQAWQQLQQSGLKAATSLGIPADQKSAFVEAYINASGTNAQRIAAAKQAIGYGVTVQAPVITYPELPVQAPKPTPVNYDELNQIFLQAQQQAEQEQQYKLNQIYLQAQQASLTKPTRRVCEREIFAFDPVTRLHRLQIQTYYCDEPNMLAAPPKWVPLTMLAPVAQTGWTPASFVQTVKDVWNQ